MPPANLHLTSRSCRVKARQAYNSLASRTQHRPQRRPISTNADVFRVSEEVQDAVRSRRPVVALETTIYTHGFPYPANLDLAMQLESIARENGAIPATIGIVDGIAHVGMSKDQLDYLVKSPHPRKLSRRDLGFAVASSKYGKPVNGGTTIAGTMILAHLAGIRVFATGGLGGVHRGGETSMDVSADLTELGRTPVAVISSGCKGFLDIGRTLEYLETQGVGVGTFADGRQGSVSFPAFWSRDSAFKSPNVIQDEAEAAAIIYGQSQLSVNSGLFMANPVAAEFEIPRSELETIIQQALDKADAAGAQGSANTPFVLDAIRDLSQGRSVRANEALVADNVRRGSRVAVKLSELENGRAGRSTAYQPQPVHASSFKKNDPTPRNIEESCDIVVAGSIAVDIACDYQPLSSSSSKQPALDTSNPASISQTVGGVGYNIARAASLMGSSVKLCSAIADDLAGAAVQRSLSTTSISTAGLRILPSTPQTKTAQYVSVNDANKDLTLAMADMRIIEQQHGSFESAWQPSLLPPNTKKPKWCIVDANWAAPMLHKWLAAARTAGIATAFEPVSVEKSARLLSQPALLPAQIPHVADVATPNALELAAMHDAARGAGLTERPDWWATIDALGIPGSGARGELVAASSQRLVDEGVPQRAIQLLPFVPCILTKIGPGGVLLARILREEDPALTSAAEAPFVVARTKTGEGGVGGLYVRLFPPAEVLGEGELVSVNGAGDTFLGALVARMARMEVPRVEEVVDVAQQASALTLRSVESVSGEIASLS